MNNETKVTHGMWAGALTSVIWGVAVTYLGVVAPPAALVAASVVVVTGAVQYFMAA